MKENSAPVVEVASVVSAPVATAALRKRWGRSHRRAIEGGCAEGTRTSPADSPVLARMVMGRVCPHCGRGSVGRKLLDRSRRVQAQKRVQARYYRENESEVLEWMAENRTRV